MCVACMRVAGGCGCAAGIGGVWLVCVCMTELYTDSYPEDTTSLTFFISFLLFFISSNLNLIRSSHSWGCNSFGVTVTIN